jgi:hypothetical protein
MPRFGSWNDATFPSDRRVTSPPLFVWVTVAPFGTLLVPADAPVMPAPGAVCAAGVPVVPCPVVVVVPCPVVVVVPCPVVVFVVVLFVVVVLWPVVVVVGPCPAVVGPCEVEAPPAGFAGAFAGALAGALGGDFLSSLSAGQTSIPKTTHRLNHLVE